MAVGAHVEPSGLRLCICVLGVPLVGCVMSDSADVVCSSVIGVDRICTSSDVAMSYRYMQLGPLWAKWKPAGGVSDVSHRLQSISVPNSWLCVIISASAHAPQVQSSDEQCTRPRHML